MSAADEKKIDQLERQFLLDAQKLISKTYDEAIKSGRSVVVSDEGALYRVDRDGRTKIKDIEKGKVVTKSKFIIHK